MTQNEIVDTLNDLIKVCNDGVEGFQAGAEHSTVDMPRLKMFLMDRRQECVAAAEALSALVREQGATPTTSTTASGSLHRGWLNIKTTLAGNDNLAVLEECERGEDAAKAAYRKALAKDLPAPIRAIVELQFQGVLRNHDLVKDLRDEEKRLHHA